MDDHTTVAELCAVVHQFVAERAWQPYHNPKNLSSSIAIEAAELMEIFQWLTSEQSVAAERDPRTRQHIREELADVVIYCLSLANAMEVDLSEAVLEKLSLSARKYPAQAYRERFHL